MTRRSRTHRLLSTLTGVWFALFSMAPQASLPCPMHESAAEVASGPGADDTHGSPGGHGGHAAHVAMAGAMADGAAGGLADAESPGSTHPCDCSTDCCGVPSATLPPTAEVRAPASLVARSTIAIDPTLLRVAPRIRLLPFANGPPALIAG